MKLIDKFKEMLSAGSVDSAEDVEKSLPDLEKALDELDKATADGLDWDDADEILGDVLPLILKSVRKQTKGKSLAEISEVVYNYIIVLKVHYGWDVWMVPESIERYAIRKIVNVAVRALDKDQKDPETDSTVVAEEEAAPEETPEETPAEDESLDEVEDAIDSMGEDD